MVRFLTRLPALALLAVLPFAANAAPVQLSAGQTQSFTFSNLSYVQDHSLVDNPNMPPQFSYFASTSANGLTTGEAVTVKIYEDSAAGTLLFTHDIVGTGPVSSGFGVTQLLNSDPNLAAVWADLQGYIEITVTAGSIAIDSLSASTIFASLVDNSILKEYRTADIISSPNGPPAGVPTPGALSLAFAALGALAVQRRLRRAPANAA